MCHPALSPSDNGRFPPPDRELKAMKLNIERSDSFEKLAVHTSLPD
jgi:hypothetical protein